jgi:hypothetical protein
MFWCKIFSTKHDIVVALCDEELIEKEIRSKELGMKVKISKNFYGEKLIDEHIALRVLKRATIGNLMGERAVALAEKNGFIIRKNVILIGGIPHAQFVKMEKIF